jgi:peptidoglycan/xylan/chitin deacetylase (PgdA/CDA1 family)
VRARDALALAALAGAAAYTLLPDVLGRRHPACLRRGPAGCGAVALTFDDGPHPELTPRVLDALRAAGARATFFLVGENALLYPGLVRRIVAEGHTLGVHTLTHRHAWLCSPARLEREMAAGLRAVQVASGGHRPEWFRPPWGSFHARTLATARRLGLRIALWSCDAGDWLPGATPEAIAARVRRGLTEGAVIDLHDGGRTPQGCRAMVQALPAILEEVRGRGLRAVGLAELCPTGAACP